MTVRVLVVGDVLTNAGKRSCRLNISTCSRHSAALDVMMPEMDGIEVCRRRNSNSATHYMPAVLVTALDLACRCGGEEFVIVIPETDMAVATMVAAAATVHCGRAVPSREEREVAGGGR